MVKKDKKISDVFCKDFKGLPLKMRVRMILTGINLLEFQKENKAAISKAADPSVYTGGGKSDADGKITEQVRKYTDTIEADAIQRGKNEGKL